VGNNDLPKPLLVFFFLSIRQGLIGLFTPVHVRGGDNRNLGNISHASSLATNTTRPLPFALVLQSPSEGGTTR
jgi:hypothetical protein